MIGMIVLLGIRISSLVTLGLEGMSSALDACLREIDTIKQKRSSKVTANKSSDLKKR